MKCFTKSSSKHLRLRICLSIACGWCIFLWISVFAASLDLNPVLARALNQADHAPFGWLLTGSKPASYTTGVDINLIHDGQPTAYLLSSEPAIDGFGTLMQSVDATNYAGKRVRLRASVKSKDLGDWAGLWMRVDKEKTMIAFDNMADRAIKGTQPWGNYDVVLDVPESATSISFGVLLAGSGEVWLNHVNLDVVGKEVDTITPKGNHKVTLPTSPVNLNFSE